MSRPSLLRRWLYCVLLASLACGSTVLAHAVPPQPAQNSQPAQNADPNAHPLDPALKRAYEGLKHIKEDIKDYTCTLIKRERIDGKLQEVEEIETKVRHEPFSVYMKFKKPDDAKGREVIFVHGANDGNLLAHERRGFNLGMVSLKPNSALAMKGNRYAITEVGIYNLTRRLVEVAENDRQFGECDVSIVPSEINQRPCTLMQVVHPVPRKNLLFHITRIYVDDEMNVPVRYEAYEWPEKTGGPPVLTEVYAYVDLKLNPGLTDADFDPQNPNYSFKK
ncbi:MAG: DUF1571 domain-containing protein [Pirellulales bacterium]|nr:DUF1571 domain-containing protein [Pirellulales bacterium]